MGVVAGVSLAVSAAPEVVATAQSRVSAVGGIIIILAGIGLVITLAPALVVCLIVWLGLESLKLLGAGMVRVDRRYLYPGLGWREYAVDHDNEPVIGPTDAGAALVDVLNRDHDLFAGLDRLGLEILDRLIVVVAPLGTTAVAVVLTPHAGDALAETGALVCEWAVRHTNIISGGD